MATRPRPSHEHATLSPRGGRRVVVCVYNRLDLEDGVGSIRMGEQKVAALRGGRVEGYRCGGWCAGVEDGEVDMAWGVLNEGYPLLVPTVSANC